MSREILFKAKTCSGEWVEGLLAHKDDKWYISNKAGMPFAFEVRPETICQYTGLTDKNGNKIWENDLVKYPDCEMSTEAGYGDCFENVGSVQWDAESMSFFFTDRVTVDMGDIIINDEVEVIGNIFDNPELMKGSEQE